MGVSPEFLSLFFLLCLAASTHACNPDDKAALRDFAIGLRRPPQWFAHNQSSDCCRWIGVNCTGNSSTMHSSRRVETLNLSNMGLTGMISGSIGNLSQLKYLDLSSNSFFGSIPKGLFAASSLKTLDLSSNTLSGNLSYALGNLSKLTRFDVSYNNLSGPIPDVFHALGENLNYLYLSSNNFSGSIPESLSACKALRVLDFGNNSLSGPVPESIFSCTNLKTLRLNNNRFGGDFPEGFGSLKSLEVLLLSKNSFSNITAALTVLNQCSNLTWLYLDENFKGESIPTDGSWRFLSLQVLRMRDSNVSGIIPTWISRLSELVYLDLSGNCLEGTIPTWFGNFKNITILRLSGNMLTGDIPASLTRPGNPAFKTVFRRLGGISYFVPSYLDLSSNLLKGTSWRSIGNLKYLTNLSLSHNSFTGSIPENFSDMRNLEGLDLSYNQISGVIPSSLQNLTFLSQFSVANNCLEGQVPTGGQLSTFPCSSFAGNHGLSLPFNCTSETPASGWPAKSPPPESKGPFVSSSPIGVILMGFPFGLGVLIGFIPAAIAYQIHQRKKQLRKRND